MIKTTKRLFRFRSPAHGPLRRQLPKILADQRCLNNYRLSPPASKDIGVAAVVAFGTAYQASANARFVGTAMADGHIKLLRSIVRNNE